MPTNQTLRHHQQKRITHRAQTTDSYSFFNLLTRPQLLAVVDERLPAHRERRYPPTTTLALFLAQAMNADASCQNTVNAHAVERVGNDRPSISPGTGAYCKARARLPLETVSTLVKQTGQWMADQAPPRGSGKDAMSNGSRAPPSPCPIRPPTSRSIPSRMVNELVWVFSLPELSRCFVGPAVRDSTRPWGYSKARGE